MVRWQLNAQARKARFDSECPVGNKTIPRQPCAGVKRYDRSTRERESDMKYDGRKCECMCARAKHEVDSAREESAVREWLDARNGGGDEADNKWGGVCFAREMSFPNTETSE